MLKLHNSYTVTASGISMRGNLRSDVLAAKGNSRSFQEKASAKYKEEALSVSGQSFSPDFTGKLIDGFLPSNDKALFPIYKNIYDYDPVAGGSVDLMSILCYSDFSLVGSSDKKQLRTFMDTTQKLKLKTLLPSITRDHLAMGLFCGTMCINTELKLFSAIVPYQADWLTFYSTPIHGVDPLIEVEIPQEMMTAYKKVLNHDKMKKQLSHIPEQLREQLLKRKFELDPSMTLYIPRRGLSTEDIGRSVYSRILMVYLLEKALSRGTVELAHRRQKAILHIMAGSDIWEPTHDQLQSISDIFAAADADPLSAIVVTRNDINVNEVRQPSDFWQWENVQDSTASLKMKALGINESLLSGDASFSTLESALSVFMDNIRTLRDTMTQEIFYNRIFPYTAHMHGFEKKGFEETGESYETYSSYNEAADIPGLEDIDFSRYVIPKVQWHKQLQPEADKDYLELLDAMTEKGIPIPLRMYAAAGGINADELMNQFADDVKLRQKFSEHKEEIAEYTKQDSDNMEESSLLQGPISMNGGLIDPSAKFGSRQYDPDAFYSTHGINHKGNRVPLSNSRKKQIDDKVNRQIAIALAEKAQADRHSRKRT